MNVSGRISVLHCYSSAKSDLFSFSKRFALSCRPTSSFCTFRTVKYQLVLTFSSPIVVHQCVTKRKTSWFPLAIPSFRKVLTNVFALLATETFIIFKRNTGRVPPRIFPFIDCRRFYLCQRGVLVEYRLPSELSSSIKLFLLLFICLLPSSDVASGRSHF